MATDPQRPERRDGLLSSLNAAIDTLDLAKELSPVGRAFFSTPAHRLPPRLIPLTTLAGNLDVHTIQS